MNRKLLIAVGFFVLGLTLTAYQTISTVAYLDANSMEFGRGGRVLGASTTGLVDYWKFDDASGSVLSDSAGTNNGINLGNATWVQSGKINGALLYDGVNAESSLPGPALAGDFTISAWVNLDSTDFTGEFLSDSSNKGGWSLGLVRYLNNKFQISFMAADVKYDTDITIAPYYNSWTHFSLVKNGTTVLYYINGSLVKTVTNIAVVAPKAPWHIMWDAPFGAAFMKGMVDELRMYNRALTSQEVTDIYNDAGAGIIVPPPASTAPVVVSFTSSSVNILSGQTVALSWVLSGGTPAAVSIDQGVGSVLSDTSKNVSPTLTTTYTLTASNSAGSASKQVTIVVSGQAADTVPPVVNISYPTATTTISGAGYSLKAVATDNVKLQSIQFYVDGQAYGATTLFAVMFNSFLYDNGGHSVYAIAQDSSGNRSTSPTVTFNIYNPVDTTPPTKPQNFNAYLITPTQAYLSWTNSTDYSGIKEYRVYRNGAWLATVVSGVAYTDNTILAGQSYTFYVVAVDNKNNISDRSAEILVSSVPQLSAVNHPRVLITPEIIAAKKANLNTLPDWPALKAKADGYLSKTVQPYDSVSAGITIGYRGSDYYEALLTLALSYQLTGNTAYADKGIQIMEAMDNAGLCFFLSESKENAWFKSLNCTSGKGDGGNGYPIRFYGTIMAIGYDWFYDRLSPTQKIAYYTQLNEWLDWYASYGFEKEGSVVSGNFFGGYLEALSLGGLATEGENPRASEYITRARNFITGTVYTQFSPGGWYYGGNEPEGFAYGDTHFVRLLNAISAFKTAKNEDLFSNKKIPEQMAKFLFHATKPNLWQMIDSGEWGGTVGGFVSKNLPLYLSQLLVNTEFGPKIQYYLQNIHKNPPAGLYPVNYEASLFSKVMYGDAARPTNNYSLSEPLFYQAEGAKQFFSRSGWDSSAIWSSFHAGAKVFSVGHENKDNGSFTIQRGDDYLIVDGSQYRQPLGWYGIGVGGYDSCNENTLYFSDFGDYIPIGYCGGQTSGGDDVANISENTSQYFYSKVDLTSAYDMFGYSKDANKKTLLRFERSFLHLRPDMFLIFDQVGTRKPTYDKKFRLHFGNEPQISGDTIIGASGGSKVFVKTLLPDSATLTKRFVSVVRSTGNVNTTWETDSYNPTAVNNDNFLNAIYVSPSSVSSMPPTNKIVVSSGNMQGVHVQNQGNHIVLFNANAVQAPIQNVSYEVNTVVGSGTHYLLGMQPNAGFKVQKDGIDIGNQTSSANGVLQFSTNGSGLFTVLSLTGGDVTPPVVSVAAPAIPNSTITGKYTLKANATDDTGVAGVQFLVDSNPVGAELTASPYQFVWDSTAILNGIHQLSVKARDMNGNIKISAAISINVLNSGAVIVPTLLPDSTAPTAFISSPINNANVANSIAVLAGASDPVVSGATTSGLSQLFLTIDGTVVATSTSTSLSYTLDTKAIINGAHTIQAIGKDKAGNVGQSLIVNITVNNIQPIDPAIIQRIIRLNPEGKTGNKTVSGTLVFISATTKAIIPNTAVNFTVNSVGDYTFTIPQSLPSGAALRVSVVGYLSQVYFGGDLTNTSLLTFIIPTLTAGDFNNDDIINSLDYSLMNSHWNQSYAGVDINTDSIVNSFDFSILKNNWGKMGQ